MNSAANAYRDVKRTTDVDGASPHQLIQLLLKTALSRISMARRNLVDDNWAEMHINIDKSLAIVHELQGSLLNPETNELSANLYNLYTYSTQQLTKANFKREDEHLQTAYQVIETLYDAWNMISPEERTLA